jgi:hypothetical protein
MSDRIDLLTRAAAEALVLRGTVTLAAPGSEHKWCAVRASAQGDIELRVGDPSGLRRMRGERWLARHGFTRVAYGWARPLARGSGAGEAAATLAAALQHALGVRHVDTLLRNVQPGAPGGVVPPAADADRTAHVAAALKWLSRARSGSTTIDLGRPARPLARAYVKGATLVVAVRRPGEEDAEDELGHYELSADGARDASERLDLRLLRDFGCAADEPLFIGLTGVTDPVRSLGR